MLGIPNIENRLDKMEEQMEQINVNLEKVVELLALLLEIENAQLTRTNQSATLLEK